MPKTDENQDYISQYQKVVCTTEKHAKEKPHAILLKARFLTMWLQSNAAASITKHPIFHFFPDKNEKYDVHRSTFEKNNVVTLKHYIFIQLVFASWIIWIYDSVKFKPL